MRKKIREKMIFTKLSIGAYCAAIVVFLSPVFLPDSILNGKIIGTLFGVLFIAGMLLQGIQLLCNGPLDADLFFIAEPRLTKEDAEELKKLLEEFDEEKE